MSVDNFINKIYSYLSINMSLHQDITLIRIRSKQLEKLGEFSFPLDIISWKHVLSRRCNEDAEHQTIFEYINATEDKHCSDDLITISRDWSFPIYKLQIITTNAHLYLNRSLCFKRGIYEVAQNGDKFGSFQLVSALRIESDLNSEDLNELSLSDLRLLKVKEIAANLLQFNNCTISDQSSTTIRFSRTSKSEDEVLIHCGPVLTTTNGKLNSETAVDYYRQRTIDMRLMAEHKYGLRITSQDGWQDIFDKLGGAAVTIELMENKPSHALKINLNNPTLSSQKNASFIMYNCARLAAIFKEFNKRVASEIYPLLPNLSEIDMDLLKEPEEWDLLFIYILQFPCVIKNVIKDIRFGKFNPHLLTTFLSGLASTFSVYYRRVRILCEPRTHLFPVMFARIYLLQSLQCVLHNALKLLDIEPVTQM